MCESVTTLIKRIEDIGRAQEHLKRTLLECSILKNLNPYDSYWNVHVTDEDEAEEVEEHYKSIRLSLCHLHDELYELLSILKGDI